MNRNEFETVTVNSHNWISSLTIKFGKLFSFEKQLYLEDSAQFIKLRQIFSLWSVFGKVLSQVKCK